MALLLSTTCAAAEPDAALGQWQAVEDGTTSIIELYTRDDLLYGRVVAKFDGAGRRLHETCARCSGAARGKPLEEIEFLHGLRKQGDRWAEGSVMDLRAGATQGAEASCDLDIQGDRAELHAYLGLRIFGQRRTWTRWVKQRDNNHREPS